MPGIVMEMEQEKEAEEDKESKLEEIASPQRSILEFFKSPTKPVEKPKNLLSYFGKPAPKQKESTETLTSQTKTEKANGKVNGLQNGINGKEQKRKVEKNSSSLNSSISEFEGHDSLTKIKKTEKKKGTKKSLKANDEASKENAESKTKDISKSKKNNVEKDVIEKIQKKEVQKETQKKKKIKDKEVKSVQDKPVGKAEVETKTNENNIRKSEQKEEENSGISYLDFLKSLENKSEEKGDEIITDNTELETVIENDCKESVTVTGNDDVKSEAMTGDGVSQVTTDSDNKNPEIVVSADDSKHDSSADENYPSITSFFTKLSGPVPKQSSSKPNSPKILTTKADIHSEPTPPKISKENKSEKTKVCTSVESDSKLNEIEIISSEVVKVDSPTKKRGTKHKDKPVKSARKSLNQKLTETVEISDDSMTVDATETKEALDRKKAFLQSDNTPSGSQKTSQATLSFVKGGFQVSSKPSHKTRIRKSEPEEMTCESPLSKSTPIKKGRGRPPSTKVQEKTPVSTKARGRPPGSTNKIKKSASDGQKPELSNASVLEDSVIKSEDTMEVYDDNAVQKRRSSRKKKQYKVDMISIDTKNRTPIRMRLTRCNKSGSSTDESSFTLKPKSNIKQTRAQKLLEKAKKSKSGKSPELKLQMKKAIKKNQKRSKLKGSAKEKRKPVETENDSSSRRRSSRLSDKFSVSMEESKDGNDDDEIMIIDDDEDHKGKKKKQKDLCTPRKGRKPSTPKTPLQNKTTSKGTPKKPSGKLAPIFMKKKAGEKVEEPKKPVLDPEQERQRREFLMSGVPEALKKQTIAASAAVILSDLPPFPAIRHVQQMEGIMGKSGIDIWNLSSVQLKIKNCEETDNTGVIQTYWNHGLLEKDKIMCDLSKIKLFKQHSKVEDSLEEPLLKEIQKVSPSYNVDKMYKLLKEKKEDQDAEMTYDIEEQKDSKSKKGESTDTGKEGKKKTKRRSLRLKKKDEVMEVIDLGSPEPVAEETSSGDNKQETAIVVPWTDKYQPTHSSEIVGNSNNVKKLKTWLIEWKHKVDKEAKKMKKLAMKESKNKTKEKEDDWWADDDSDFNVDSEGTEDEEDKLCNTVMLMGPTGVGKSTTVYALAQEIGFKVFEVNASSIRNGKRILTQLQEATQSHRVSHKSCGDAGPASIFTQGNKPSPRKKPEKEKNAPTSFANFFNKTTNSKPVETEKSKKSNDSKNARKRKRDLEESDAEKTPKKKKGKDEKGVKFDGLIPTTSNQTAGTNQGLNLSSTSLILFEDVDVVFEEDKGFWSAIQTFMNSTKIPIVLTTNDVTLSSKFEGRYEQFLFKTPSMKQTTVYLQLICLAESIRTNSEEIMTLVKVLSGDIRRCLLALQYWIESGGGTLQEVQKIISPVKLKPLTVIEDTCSQNAIKASSISGDSKSRFDDDDDFVVMKPVVNKRKRPLISDDESSNSAQPFPPAMESTEKQEVALQSSVHLSCLNSSLGLSLGGSEGIMNLLKQLVKGERDDLVTVVTEACDQYRKLMYNIVYNTYIDLLPMPKSQQTTPPSIKTKVKEKKTQLKRIKTFDLYDSEASNDGILDEPKEESLEETKTEESKEEKVAIVKSLDQLTEFYDNMSFIDSITIDSEVPESSNSFILHSKRCLHDTDITSSLEYIDKDNLCSEIEVRALYKLCTNQGQIQDTLKGQHIESLSIPSAGSQSQGVLVNRASNSKNLVLKKASNNVMSNLPLNVRCHQRSVVMDYMPTLREISKSEKLREMAKIKRRFHHYFDNIGLNFKDTTLDVMFTSFQ